MKEIIFAGDSDRRLCANGFAQTDYNNLSFTAATHITASIRTGTAALSIIAKASTVSTRQLRNITRYVV